MIPLTSSPILQILLSLPPMMTVVCMSTFSFGCFNLPKRGDDRLLVIPQGIPHNRYRCCPGKIFPGMFNSKGKVMRPAPALGIVEDNRNTDREESVQPFLDHLKRREEVREADHGKVPGERGTRPRCCSIGSGDTGDHLHIDYISGMFEHLEHDTCHAIDPRIASRYDGNCMAAGQLDCLLCPVHLFSHGTGRSRSCR